MKIKLKIKRPKFDDNDLIDVTPRKAYVSGSNGNGSHKEGWTGKDKVNGQFLMGHKRAVGRPIGGRNKLGEAFILKLKEDFDKHGEEAIRQCRRSDPVAYVQVLAKLVPKQHEVAVSMNPIREMTDEELKEHAAELHRRVGQSLVRRVDGGSGGDRTP